MLGVTDGWGRGNYAHVGGGRYDARGCTCDCQSSFEVHMDANAIVRARLGCTRMHMRLSESA